MTKCYLIAICTFTGVKVSIYPFDYFPPLIIILAPLNSIFYLYYSAAQDSFNFFDIKNIISL